MQHALHTYRGGIEPMLIRSTPYACLVFLKNGLTLELVYDRRFKAMQPPGVKAEDDPAALNGTSHGVWMFREEVLCEVRAGQA
jgi:hypothetical protein